MDQKEIKLAVRNLKISFRTDGGKVQAVRDISFDLNKGETLAIVGESGSGKSVTSRAILGILANNAIKDGGEILYDGEDLMKISEEEFCRIRGDKIAMIFQDPLSSLNPIMRVGKQMTEAMLIKGRLNQRSSRRDFNTMLALLNKCMDAALGADDKAVVEKNKQMCSDFNKFEIKHLELENAYLSAKEACAEAISAIDDIVFHIEKNATEGMNRETKEVVKLAKKTYNKYVVEDRAFELFTEIDRLNMLIKVPFFTKLRNAVVPVFKRGAAVKDVTNYAAVRESLLRMRDILAEAVEFDEPNFFSMGYYLTFSGEPLPHMPVKELNAFLRKYLDEHFMLEFISLAKQGIIYSNKTSVEKKKAALDVFAEYEKFFDGEFDRKQAAGAEKTLVAAVENGIDRLETLKDNIAYTFRSSLHSAIEQYFGGIVRNEKEEKRFAKQTAAYDKKVAKGKTPDWKVADKNLVDLALAREDIKNLIKRIQARYEANIAAAPDIDFDARAVDMIDYLKLKASGVAHKVTRAMAKAHALKLLEEVGIPEPRKRFRQYPFEFSGGMRQRIVIAIALSANPDILICDEPTTALDVTIQSQILELINKVKAERNLSVIFITHDLGVVANMADRVAVMYAGKIVEIGTDEDIFYAPAHPYTWALLSSMPDLDTKEKLEAIPGTPPNMIYPPKGDAFAERNKYAMQIDFEMQPPMFKISDTHSAATWLLHPNAPKIDPPKIITDRIARMKQAAESAQAQNASGSDATVEQVETEPVAAPSVPVDETAESVKASIVNKAADGGVTAEVSLIEPSGADETAATKAPKAKSAASKKPAAAKKPTTAKKSTTAKPSGEKPATAAKPATAGKSTAAKSAATAKKPTTAKSTGASKSAAAKKSTTAAKPKGADKEA